MVDALNRKSKYLATLLAIQKRILKDLNILDTIMMIRCANSYIANMILRLTLIKRIKKKQNEDLYLLKVEEEIALKRNPTLIYLMMECCTLKVGYVCLMFMS